MCDPALYTALIEPVERARGHFSVRWGDVHERLVVLVDGRHVPTAFETFVGDPGVVYSHSGDGHRCTCNQGALCVTVARGDVRVGARVAREIGGA